MNSDNIIIHPRKGKNEQPVPETGIVLVTPSEADYGHSLLRQKQGSQSFLYHSKLTVDAEEKIFVAGPAVGAPMAAMTLEKLVALGARNIIMFGWCGAASPVLQVGDVLVGGKGFIGEGTSQYYNSDRSAQPSHAACRKVSEVLMNNGIELKFGNLWSTDAPYREDRSHIARLRDNDDIVAVDMEYSALCSVSNFRKIQFAAVFLVSDELYHESWKPGFKGRPFKDKSRSLVRLLCEAV